jgi:hypothetical protein
LRGFVRCVDADEPAVTGIVLDEAARKIGIGFFSQNTTVCPPLGAGKVIASATGLNGAGADGQREGKACLNDKKKLIRWINLPGGDDLNAGSAAQLPYGFRPSVS